MNQADVAERRGALKSLNSNVAYYRGTIVSVSQLGTRWDVKLKSDDGTGSMSFEVVKELIEETTIRMASGKPVMLKVEQFSKEENAVHPAKRIIVEVQDARSFGKVPKPAAPKKAPVKRLEE